MTQLKDIEKKFKAGAFPESTSLEEKVKIVNEFRRELKAYKRHIAKENLEKGFEDEVEIITRLIWSLSRRVNRAVKKVDKDFEKIIKLNREFKSENSSLEDKVKITVELHQELKAQKERKDELKIITKLIQNLENRMDRAATKIAQDFEKIAQQHGRKGVFISEKAAEFESSKKSQNIPRGKISEQNKQEKISVQTDKIHASVSKIGTTKKAVSEDKNFEQKKTSVQIDTKPLVSAKQPSVSKDFITDKSKDKKSEAAKITLKQTSADKNATERKPDNIKPQLSEKKNIAQPRKNQKEEGFLGLLRRLFKKFLENLFGENEVNLKDTKEKVSQMMKSSKKIS